MKYLLLFVLLFIPATTQAVWFDSNWDYRVPIEIVPSKVGTTSAVTSFPVYVKLADMPGDFWSNVQSDGDDIRMVEGDETTETAFELVTISTASSTGELHFLADSLGTTSTSTFYLYYGNSGASGYASTTTYGSQAVWVNGFVSVYHLPEDPTGTAPQYADSVGPARGTSTAMEAADRTAAQIGNGITIDGSAEYITSSASFTVTTSTWSVWLNANGTQGSYDGVVYNRSGAVSGIMIGKTSSQIGYTWADNFNTHQWTSAPTYPTNSWFLATLVIRPANATVFVQQPSGLSSSTNAVANASQAITAVNFGRDPFGGRLFNGSMDEVRISNVERGVGWIVTEYNNQSTTTNFYYIGAQETDGGGGGAVSTPQSIMWFD